MYCENDAGLVPIDGYHCTGNSGVVVLLEACSESSVLCLSPIDDDTRIAVCTRQQTLAKAVFEQTFSRIAMVMTIDTPLRLLTVPPAQASQS